MCTVLNITFNMIIFHMRTIECCIFRPAFGCCVLQTLVVIVIFSIFAAKKLKKARILQQISAKNRFELLVKNVFLEKKAHFFGNKTVDQCSGANLRKTVFCRNLLQISCFFRFFAAKTLVEIYNNWGRNWCSPTLDGRWLRAKNKGVTSDYTHPV